MKKINWGIIGLGRVANEFASGFNGLKNANLIGVASKTSKKLIISTGMSTIEEIDDSVNAIKKANTPRQ